MPEYRANKQNGETHDIPDGEEVVSQRTVGGVEILQIEEVERFECMEETYDKVFDSERGMKSHYSQTHDDGGNE